MGHYAKIENGIVVQVNVVEEDYFNENRETRYTGQWVQTSYNTKGGVHYNPKTGLPSEDQSKALRKNYAGVGHIYDEQRDAFYVPQPFPSWILNEETCIWEAPIAEPDDEKFYRWDEKNQQWIDTGLTK